MSARLFLLLAWGAVTFLTVGFFPWWLALPVSTLALICWTLVSFFPDKLLLHYLQARETIERDHPRAYRMARSQCHKFKLTAPRLYGYNGFFNRSFALAMGDRVVFVVDRKIIETAKEHELSALFFSLALEVHHRLAHRHTLALMLVVVVWLLPLKLIGLLRPVRPWQSWTAQFWVAPLAQKLYGLCMPEAAWQRFLHLLSAYPLEESQLYDLNARLEQPVLSRDISRTLAFRFYASHHAPAQQMILALEGSHHLYDFFRGDQLRIEHA